jgi:AraC-like DNA-binding protein
VSATYLESPPPAPLASHACCVWSNAAGGGDHVERVLPDGCADIVWIDGDGIVVAGPATRQVLVEIPAGTAAMGVRFGPGAAGAALGVAAHELRDRTVALEDVWGAEATELAERLAGTTRAGGLAILARAVARRLDGAPAPDPLVTRASDLLARGIPVTETSREVALTDRHLRRRFHDAVGYGPKTLQRVLRLRRFLALAESGTSPDLARAAVEAGYFDQPHLTRECAELAGLPPAALLASRAAAASSRG